MLLNRIEPEIERILRENHIKKKKEKKHFQILTIPRVIEGFCAKNLELTLLLVDFF